jgi:hypothetical protein
VHKISNPQVPLEGSETEGMSRGGACEVGHTHDRVIKLLHV